jgi:arginine decarboxylase
VFGADTSYFVLNGTSTANQLVAHSCVVTGDAVLADRNCHKSVSHALTVTDAIPVYVVPSRNGYGITGPVPASQLSRQANRRVRRPQPADPWRRRRRPRVRRRHQLDL